MPEDSGPDPQDPFGLGALFGAGGGDFMGQLQRLSAGSIVM